MSGTQYPACYEEFAEAARQCDLSTIEKIGFGSYAREDKPIFNDLLTKLPKFKTCSSLKVLDIGAGCGNLPHLFAQLCQEKNIAYF